MCPAERGGREPGCSGLTALSSVGQGTVRRAGATVLWAEASTGGGPVWPGALGKHDVSLSLGSEGLGLPVSPHLNKYREEGRLILYM